LAGCWEEEAVKTVRALGPPQSWVWSPAQLKKEEGRKMSAREAKEKGRERVEGKTYAMVHWFDFLAALRSSPVWQKHSEAYSIPLKERGTNEEGGGRTLVDGFGEEREREFGKDETYAWLKPLDWQKSVQSSWVILSDEKLALSKSRPPSGSERQRVVGTQPLERAFQEAVESEVVKIWRACPPPHCEGERGERERDKVSERCERVGAGRRGKRKRKSGDVPSWRDHRSRENRSCGRG
jgi:hypothetical protein